jgi:hypothetical protein
MGGANEGVYSRQQARSIGVYPGGFTISNQLFHFFIMCNPRNSPLHLSNVKRNNCWILHRATIIIHYKSITAHISVIVPVLRYSLRSPFICLNVGIPIG